MIAEIQLLIKEHKNDLLYGIKEKFGDHQKIKRL